LAWFVYYTWSIEDEILRFAQDDNLLGGWRMDTQLAICTTQNDKGNLGGFINGFALLSYVSHAS
jgi:hypothetical protein